MKKQSRILIAAVLIFVVLSVIFVACDSDGSKEATRKAREIAQKSEYYISLDETEKKEFDDELNEIIDSEYFKSLDENGKSELVGKFVESEKTIKEIANDPKDKNPEDLDVAIAQKQAEFENAKNGTQALKDSGSSYDEIAKAEEKQCQAETQLEAVKQERTYWEIIKTVKEAVSTDEMFWARNPDTTVRRVNSIYSYGGHAFFNIDIVREEVLGGKSFFSQGNMFCRTSDVVLGEETTDAVLEKILNAGIISADKICSNRNSQELLEKFDTIKNDIPSLTKLYGYGYTLSVVESWETVGHAHPEYIVKAKSEDDERWYIVMFSENQDKYGRQYIYKICPEFWAQLEIERAKSNSNV